MHCLRHASCPAGSYFEEFVLTILATIKGTSGAELIPEAQAPNRLVVPNLQGTPLPENVSSYQQIVLEKNTLDVFDNPNTDALLNHPDLVSLTSDPNLEFVVFGVATEYCVRVEVEGLLRRGRRVTVVSDAIRSLDPVQWTRVLEDLRLRGVLVKTTKDVLASLSECSKTGQTKLVELEQAS